jgi:uncharacterized membrane protein
MKTPICSITHQPIAPGEGYRGDELRPSIFALIQKAHPGFLPDSYICLEELSKFRHLYLTTLVNQQGGELNALDQEVMDAIHNNKLLSENIELDIEDQLTVGQRLADQIAEFGGSWTFIIFFFSFIVVWMLVNVVVLASHAFDGYPFILLNLILSCLAAIQAPIIMMSQNRREQKDRQRSEHDYKINLKAELEIKLLHEKIDHMMAHQNKRLLEIQQLQTDYLEDLMREIRNVAKGQES